MTTSCHAVNFVFNATRYVNQNLQHDNIITCVNCTFYIFISFPTLIALGAREEDGFCVSMSANHPVGLWSTFNCTTLSSFICEFHRVGFTTPSTAPPTTTLPKSCETGWLELDGNCYKVCVKLFNSTESTLHFNIECVHLILKKN